MGFTPSTTPHPADSGMDRQWRWGPLDCGLRGLGRLSWMGQLQMEHSRKVRKAQGASAPLGASSSFRQKSSGVAVWTLPAAAVLPAATLPAAVGVWLHWTFCAERILVRSEARRHPLLRRHCVSLRSRKVGWMLRIRIPLCVFEETVSRQTQSSTRMRMQQYPSSGIVPSTRGRYDMKL